MVSIDTMVFGRRWHRPRTRRVRVCDECNGCMVARHQPNVNAIRFNAGIEELDLEAAIDDRSRLSDQLVHARLNRRCRCRCGRRRGRERQRAAARRATRENGSGCRVVTVPSRDAGRGHESGRRCRPDGLLSRAACLPMVQAPAKDQFARCDGEGLRPPRCQDRFPRISSWTSQREPPPPCR